MKDSERLLIDFAFVCDIRINFYIHGSLNRDSVRSNEMQQYAGVYLQKITLHVSGVYRTHHQEYIKV